MGFGPRIGSVGWRIVGRDVRHIMLGKCPEVILPQDLGDQKYFGYIYVDNLDFHHAEIKERGVNIKARSGDKPRGMREMAVMTLDGHRVMFENELAG